MRNEPGRLIVVVTLCGLVAGCGGQHVEVENRSYSQALWSQVTNQGPIARDSTIVMLGKPVFEDDAGAAWLWTETAVLDVPDRSIGRQRHAFVLWGTRLHFDSGWNAFGHPNAAPMMFEDLIIAKYRAWRAQQLAK